MHRGGGPVRKDRERDGEEGWERRTGEKGDGEKREEGQGGRIEHKGGRTEAG